jgi:hypothetical protein
MKILLLAMGQDTGGVLSGIRRAFRNEPGWTVHTMVSTVNYIEYEVDIPWQESRLQRWWTWADVIHVQHRMAAVERLTGGWHNFRFRHKPYVISFHGSQFREDSKGQVAEMRRFGALGRASTLDLWLLAPKDVEWQPNPTSVVTMQMMRRRHQRTQKRYDQTAEAFGMSPSNPVRIAHAPTNREIKSTEAFLDACARLKAMGANIEVDLIEGVSWDTCLERKARADIYFDQVILGYGNNAIECWGMGIPVIAGAAPDTLAEMKRRFGELPFYLATEETIFDALADLVSSQVKRDYYGKLGLEHARKYHDEQVVVEQLKALYTQAVNGVQAA